jgi:dienelactone hydrolase
MGSALLAWTACPSAQEVVQFPLDNATENVDGLLTYPAAANPAGRLPAVVLVHSSWGWADAHEGVSAYANALQNAGFVTFELRLFPTGVSSKKGGVEPYLPHLFGSLKYLAARPDIDPQRVSVAGFSFGGMLALVSATRWANETHGKPGLHFAAHASFYPVCWLFKANLQGRPSPIPTTAWQTWTGTPVRIFAGAADDYDDRDPNACQDFVNAIPEGQRPAFSVQVYPDATHGWDQPVGANFFAKIACKGKGCYNVNSPDRKTTEQSTKEVIEFLSKPSSR